MSIMYNSHRMELLLSTYAYSISHSMELLPSRHTGDTDMSPEKLEQRSLAMQRAAGSAFDIYIYICIYTHTYIYIYIYIFGATENPVYAQPGLGFGYPGPPIQEQKQETPICKL